MEGGVLVSGRGSTGRKLMSARMDAFGMESGLGDVCYLSTSGFAISPGINIGGQSCFEGVASECVGGRFWV